MLDDTRSVGREELLEILKDYDEESQKIFNDDYIPNWDKKGLWNISAPIGLFKDGELVSIIFYNHYPINTNTYEKVLYIQRVYTFPKHRKKGYFAELIENLYALSFEQNCRYIEMFCDTESWGAYKKLAFVFMLNSKDDKYKYVFLPMIYSDVTMANVMLETLLLSGVSVDQFYTMSALNHVKSQALKYELTIQ